MDLCFYILSEERLQPDSDLRYDELVKNILQKGGIVFPDEVRDWIAVETKSECVPEYPIVAFFGRD